MAQAPNPTGVMFRFEFPNLRVLTVPPNAWPVPATKVAIRFLVGFDELAGRTTHRVCRAESGLGARRSLNKFFEAEDWEGPSYQTCRDAAWVADRSESLCDG
jgi:hypothetical protein